MDSTLIQKEVHTLKSGINAMMERINALDAVIAGDYLTTRQFAVLVGRDPKTISNKASAGGFEQAKFEDGQWHIHKDELKQYHR